MTTMTPSTLQEARANAYALTDNEVIAWLREAIAEADGAEDTVQLFFRELDHRRIRYEISGLTTATGAMLRHVRCWKEEPIP